MKTIALFLILALSLGAALVTWKMVAKEKKEVAPVVQTKEVVRETPVTEVAVARNDIPIGAVIKADMVESRAWPTNLIPQGDLFVAREGIATEVVGRVARSSLRRGEPIIKTLLANPLDPSFLAASIKDGMRAVTIQIDGISGIAGFVYPGDIVDVMLTHNINLPGGGDVSAAGIISKEPVSVSEVLVSGVRVMAIDQRFQVHAGDPPVPGSSATLEVSGYDAQKLRLAETKGKLSLVLRSLRRDDSKKADPLPRPVGVGDLSRITMPSLFPALYEGGDKVMPRVIHLDPGQAEWDSMQVPDQSLLNADSSGVVVVRGVQRQVEGAK